MTTFAGRYRIEKLLGSGGMGDVFQAKDLRLLRTVAVKVLHAKAMDEQSLFLFHREARAVAQLDHPCIPRIFDYSGPDETPPYIVLALIDGADVFELLQIRGTFPNIVALGITQSLASALAHAHENDIVHRDLKPGNVMLTRDGKVYLTDFGLAKAHGNSSRLGESVAARATQLFGTPEFMAPEHLASDISSPRSDVFCLGALMYALLTGQSPFHGGEVMDVMRRIINAEYTPLDDPAVRPDLPQETVHLVHRALSLDPDQRPSAAEIEVQCADILRTYHVQSSARNAIAHFLAEPTHDPDHTYIDEVTSVESFSPKSAPAPLLEEQPSPRVQEPTLISAQLVQVEPNSDTKVVTQIDPVPDDVASISLGRLLLGFVIAGCISFGAVALMRTRTQSSRQEPPAHVNVHVSAPAEVQLDGQPLGRLHAAGTIDASAGRHTITVIHPKVGMRVQTVVFEFGDIGEVNFDFEE